MSKKKNSTKGHNFVSGPNGPDTYEPPYIQPPGINATCHLHKKPVGFKSAKELQAHVLKDHRVWKG